jgi:mRNA interferase MazF
MRIRRGEIVLANLEPVVGSEQGRTRPVLIIQNDDSNEFSPTTIVAPITTKIYTKEFATNVEIESSDSGLKNRSTILLNQIRTIDRSRIVRKISFLDREIMDKVDLAIGICLGLN